MFKHEPGGDGQRDTGNPQRLTLTCLQTHFSWRGMHAKQNRMRFASEERGGVCVLALKSRTLKITQKKSHSATYMALSLFDVVSLRDLSDHAAMLRTRFTALLECEWSPLTPCTNTWSKQAYQRGLLEQDKH